MTTRRRRPAFLSSLALLSAAAVAVPLPAQEPKTEPAQKAAHVFENGEAIRVDAFKKRSDWIREWLWVETSFDSDGDGKKDRMHVDVTRPKQTRDEGLKVPVVYNTSPYFAGMGPLELYYYWPVDQQLGAPPPPRKEMAPIAWGKQAGMISEAEVQEWLPRGYAVVHSCSPGTGWSQGCATVGGENERQAPRAVIDWLCGRAKGFKTIDGKDEVTADWCTGKVGMIGTSYEGTLPVAAATTGVEGLMAIIPIAPAVSWYHYYRCNGLVRNPGGYPGEDLDVLYDFIASGDPARRGWCTEHVRDGLLAKKEDRATGDLSEFWAERDYMNKLGDWHAATLVAHGFNDWNVMPEQSVDLLLALKKKGVPCAAFFHQHGHGGPPPRELMHRWFTRFLFGVENGVEKEGPKAWIVRENDKNSKPTPYADYPNPDAAPVQLYCKGDGNEVGVLAADKRSAGSGTIVDDASKKGSELAMAAESPHRLLFATAVLKEPLHLSGTARVQIKLACDKPATNLSVWLVSLPWTDAPRITDDIITRGWFDPQNAKSLSQSVPLVPGKFVDLAFDLNPDDQVIAAGEQIGLMIFASDNEFTLHPKPGTKLSIDLDATSLTLPVVGGTAAFMTATGAPANGQR